MVNAKHCCWGTCPSDSRYSEKLPKQGIEKSDGNVCSSNVLIVIDLTVLVFLQELSQLTIFSRQYIQ